MKWIQSCIRSCTCTSAELRIAPRPINIVFARLETKLSCHLPALCSTGKLADHRDTVSICELAQLNLLILGTNSVVPSLVIPPPLSLLICWFLFCQSTQYRSWGLIFHVCCWERSAKIILRTIHRTHQGLDTTLWLSFKPKSDLVFWLLDEKRKHSLVDDGSYHERTTLQGCWCPGHWSLSIPV